MEVGSLCNLCAPPPPAGSGPRARLQTHTQRTLCTAKDYRHTHSAHFVQQRQWAMGTHTSPKGPPTVHALQANVTGLLLTVPSDFLQIVVIQATLLEAGAQWDKIKGSLIRPNLINPQTKINWSPDHRTPSCDYAHVSPSSRGVHSSGKCPRIKLHLGTVLE